MAGLSLPIDAADALRREAWRLTARTGIGRLCIVDRPTRLSLLAISSMVVALSLTVIAPMWMMLLGPILLGVPHIAGDIRYLVLRPPAPLRRAFLACLLFPFIAQTGLRAWLLFDGPHLAFEEMAMGVGAVSLAIVLAPGAWWRRGLVALALAPIAYWALSRPTLGGLALAHLHNFIALAFWMFLASRAMPAFKTAAVGMFFLFCCGLLMLGFLDAATARCIGFAEPVPYFSVSSWASVLAPGLPETLALRLVQVYIFAQAVHYTVWLRLVPQQMNEIAAPTTFRQDFSTLRRDFGWFGLACVAAMTLAILLYALKDAYMANTAYLSLVIFHGWLELACIAYFAVSGLKLTR